MEVMVILEKRAPLVILIPQSGLSSIGPSCIEPVQEFLALDLGANSLVYPHVPDVHSQYVQWHNIPLLVVNIGQFALGRPDPLLPPSDNLQG